MGFDDLARHMASREGQQVAAPSDANDFIRRAAEENRRIDRRNDIILGAILLVGGLGVGTLALQVTLETGARTGLLGASLGGVVWGAQRLIRGFHTSRFEIESMTTRRARRGR